MINPKFHIQAPAEAKKAVLDGKKIEGEYPILMLFSVNKKRLQYYTQVRMPINYYTKNGKYPFSSKWLQSAHAKAKLDNMLRHALTIESQFIKSGAAQTPESYKIELDKLVKGRQEAPQFKVTLEDQIQEYIDHVKKTLSPHTSRNTKTNLNHLRQFFGNKILKISAADLTDNLIEDYADYLKQDRLNNTVVKALQILRTFMHFCLKKKHIAKVPNIDTGKANDITVIHLNYDEVMKVAYTPMPSLALEKIRDFFVLGCFTGMRYNDIAMLKKDNCFADRIEFFNSKSGNTQSIKIPYNDMSRLIIQKYESTPGLYAVPSISNQKTNDALKEVGLLAGIDSKIEIAHKNGAGRIRKEVVTKNTLISCHTSRKSYITIAMTIGMKESTIKSITGHTKGSKAFHKYYDVVDQIKQEEMQLFNR